ncbi:MAG: NAD(P)H-dependent glycerol-3-phosphate dehydrogenase [Deinococcales bacterium]
MLETMKHPKLLTQLSIIGAGAWGTMLALLLAQKGHVVKLWTRHQADATTINHQRENKRYLPHLTLPDNLTASSDLNECASDIVIIAVPSQALREVMSQLPQVAGLVCATKGLELRSFKRFSQVLAEYQPQATLAALSGPNLAKEIAQGLPATTIVASSDKGFAERVQGYFHQKNFRVYASDDVIGVELGGALKNIIALAAGMCEALALGDNAKAALVTRGLAEILRFSVGLGARAETIFGLAGLGDLLATCSSPLSRNHRAGQLLAQGKTLADLKAAHITTEGIPTCEAVYHYSQKNNISMPISHEVYEVIFNHKPAQQAIESLLARDSKNEW